MFYVQNDILMTRQQATVTNNFDQQRVLAVGDEA